MMTPAPSVPMFRAVWGFFPSLVRTRKVPRTLAAMPKPASTSGRIT